MEEVFHIPGHLALSNILSYLNISELAQILTVSRAFYTTVYSLGYFQMFHQILKEKNLAKVLQIVRAKGYTNEQWREWKLAAYMSERDVIRKYFVGETEIKHDVQRVVQSGSLYWIRYLLKKKFEHATTYSNTYSINFFILWDKHFSDTQDDFLRQCLTEEQLHLLAPRRWGDPFLLLSTMHFLQVYTRICDVDTDRILFLLRDTKKNDRNFLEEVFVKGITQDTWMIRGKKSAYGSGLLKYCWNSLYDLAEEGFNLLLEWDTLFPDITYQAYLLKWTIDPKNLQEYIRFIEDGSFITNEEDWCRWEYMKRRFGTFRSFRAFRLSGIKENMTAGLYVRLKVKCIHEDLCLDPSTDAIKEVDVWFPDRSIYKEWIEAANTFLADKMVKWLTENGDVGWNPMDMVEEEDELIYSENALHIMDYPYS